MNSKQVAVIVLIIVIFSVGAYTFGWTMGANFDPSSTYTAPARVAEIDETTGWVTFVDWAGEAWCVRGEGYEIDQLVVITFNDNNTESIYDDMIVDVDCLVDIEEVE